MKTIVCEYQLFTFKQNINIVDEKGVVETVKASGAELGKTIAELCAKYKVKNVKLLGSKAFLEKKVAPEIQELTATQYAMKGVKVEII